MGRPGGRDAPRGPWVKRWHHPAREPEDLLEVCLLIGQEPLLLQRSLLHPLLPARTGLALPADPSDPGRVRVGQHTDSDSL